MKWILMILMICLAGCSADDDQYAYYGRLDTDVIRLSAQVNGTIDSLFAEEGLHVRKNQLLAVIDSKKILAQKQQQSAQQSEIDRSIMASKAQYKQVDIQLQHAQRNLSKTDQMLKTGAATEQNKDDWKTKVDVFKAQGSVIMQNIRSLEEKKKQVKSALKITQLRLEDSRIYSPVNGIILNRFRLENELVNPGNPIFEVADLTQMEANIYLPLAELAKIKLGQQVTVKVDGVEESFEGSIRWISSESEFTPKTILTKETRTTLVYRVKIEIPNPDGVLKIGMPVDILI